MSILVTGGAGYIGLHIGIVVCRRLSALCDVERLQFPLTTAA